MTASNKATTLPQCMDSKEVKAHLKEQALVIEGYLAQCLKNRDIPQGLAAAMEYSLLAGGKRLRPVLCLTVAELFGVAPQNALPFAAAIECIHSYSLIHDDLPCMDNDDLRRGLPTNHKKFGECLALLAGDALLTEAFVFMASAGKNIAPKRVLAALGMVAKAAGAAGMVGGQVLDMDYTGKDNVSLEMLRAMHALKTGALLRASCLSGALLAGATSENCTRIREYGTAFGIAFQIMDDILDIIGTEEELGKPVGSDTEQGKNTYPSLVGLEKSRVLMQEQIDKALAAIAPYSDKNATFLRGLAQYVGNRVS